MFYFHNTYFCIINFGISFYGNPQITIPFGFSFKNSGRKQWKCLGKTEMPSFF